MNDFESWMVEDIHGHSCRPALARARCGPLIYGPGQPDPYLDRAVSCPPTGCGNGPSTGPAGHFVPGQPGIHGHERDVGPARSPWKQPPLHIRQISQTTQKFTNHEA
jgi:hypothetical protein